jgi:uncharacterized protein (TIGR03067 family)
MSWFLGGAGDAVGDEHKKLDGVWFVESVVRDPRENNPDEGKGLRCIIRGERVTVYLPGEDKPAGALVIDIHPAKKPKALDIRPAGEKDSAAAIYELKGDTLRVCWSPLGKDRPKAFGAPAGSGQGLVVLKRKKA